MVRLSSSRNIVLTASVINNVVVLTYVGLPSPWFTMAGQRSTTGPIDSTSKLCFVTNSASPTATQWRLCP
ncbi:hypothetical protein PIB30_101357, partial [Stylosanthes scabra]|nr:hypothetical protein [Stylosanthes scabra]